MVELIEFKQADISTFRNATNIMATMIPIISLKVDHFQMCILYKVTRAFLLQKQYGGNFQN